MYLTKVHVNIRLQLYVEIFQTEFKMVDRVTQWLLDFGQPVILGPGWSC